MKKILLLLFFLSIILSNIYSQGYDKNCYFGFIFEVSNNPNWGYGELVITEVEPNSPAEKTGIQVGDIIMEINGNATYLRTNQTIASWLFDDMYATTVKFTIRNMNTYFKEYTLEKECIAINSVNERQISQIFSFYSLENTNNRIFTLPINVETNKKAEFTDYHSFDIYSDSKNAPVIDGQISELLERELISRGLVRDRNNPDLVVQAYYNYAPNPKFTGLSNPNFNPNTWRFDYNSQQMVRLAVFDPNDPNKEKAGQYIVEYGFSFYDRKYIDTNNLTQIWDCNIKDYLAASYPLADYVKLHTPLMLKQFPYTTEKKGEAKYKVDFNRYNYTGMHFDADDLYTVKDVDINSPAYKAGIRTGYEIRKINDKKFEHTKESLSEAYKSFIYETMPYRDESTRFTDADGYKDCMFWNKIYYQDIAKQFAKPKYEAAFSYLYEFTPYVNTKGENKIYVDAWDGMQLRKFTIIPEIRKYVILKAL